MSNVTLVAFKAERRAWTCRQRWTIFLQKSQCALPNWYHRRTQRVEAQPSKENTCFVESQTGCFSAFLGFPPPLNSSPPAHGRLECISSHFWNDAQFLCAHVSSGVQAGSASAASAGSKRFTAASGQDRCPLSCLWHWAYNTTQHTAQCCSHVDTTTYVRLIYCTWSVACAINN